LKSVEKQQLKITSTVRKTSKYRTWWSKFTGESVCLCTQTNLSEEIWCD